MSHFMDGSSWVPGKVELGVELKGGEGMSFPHPSDNMETPLFFGIDIRSQRELKLGRLPKVLPAAIARHSLTVHLFIECKINCSQLTLPHQPTDTSGTNDNKTNNMCAGLFFGSSVLGGPGEDIIILDHPGSHGRRGSLVYNWYVRVMQRLSQDLVLCHTEPNLSLS